MKMEINGVQTELSVEEFVKLSEILESKTEDVKEVTGYEIARNLIDDILDEEEEEADDDRPLPNKFSVGDVVMVNDSVEDIGVIVKNVNGVWELYKVEYSEGLTEWCYPRELHRLEGEELAEYNRDHVGEGHIVVITGNTNYSGNNVGDIGKVINRKLNGFSSVFVKVPGGPEEACYTWYKEMRLATADERKQYEEAVAELVEESVEEAPFKVGDKVRVIVPSTEDPQFGWSVVNSGDVGVVNEVFPDKISVTFEYQKYWSALPSELELFDEDADLPVGTTVKDKTSEIVYTVESRDTNKDVHGYGKAYNMSEGGWAGIDQLEVLNVPLTEPTPTSTEHVIEVGDIVQVTEDSYGHTVGTIGIVESVDSFGDTTVSAVTLDNGEFVVYEEESVKLIAKHCDRKDV